MKKALFLLLSCISILGCSDDESPAITQPEAIEKASMSVKYNGEDLVFTDISINPGGPDSAHALELISIIPYDDVYHTKYSLVMNFDRDETGGYTLYNITLGVTERLGQNSFAMKGYYAYSTGEFATPNFWHSTSTSIKSEKEHSITGTFNGTLIRDNDIPESIQILEGKFSADFTAFIP